MRRCGAPSVVLGWVLVAAALSSGCSAPPPPPPAPLVVEFAGCTQTLFPGPVCVLGPERRLVLWVPQPLDTEITVRLGGQPLEEAGEPIDEGLRFILTIPADAERVEVSARESGSAGALWSLVLSAERAPKPGERDVQGEIKSRSGKTAAADGTFELIQALELSKARESLEDLESLAPSAALPAESRYFLSYYGGLLADKEGDVRKALDELGASIAIARHAGDVKNSWLAHQKLALVLANLGRSGEAAEMFAQLGSNSPPLPPCFRGQFVNNWAWTTLLAREADGGSEPIGPASRVEPVQLLEQAIETYSSSPDCPASEIFNSRLNLVLAHLQEGRADRAARALASAREGKTKSTLFQELWELDLAARIDLARHRPRAAVETYRRLDRISESVGAPDGRLRAALGLARATRDLGDRDKALSILHHAETLLDGQSLQVPLYAGRMTFVSQREGVASLEVQILLDAGRTDEALGAARRARSRILRQLDVTERLASLGSKERQRWGEEIGRYTRSRDEIDSALHDEWTLLSGERATEQAARENQARAAAAQLDNALRLLGPPAREPKLAPIASGDLLLAFHPVARRPGSQSTQWVAFAADGVRVRVHSFSLSSDRAGNEALAAAILSQFRQEISNARQVRVLPYGALRHVDFHALPFDGDVLLAAKPVIYGLDLGPAPEPTGARPKSAPALQALIVADPSRNLPGSLAEAQAVARQIQTWKPPWKVETLEGSAAQADAVSARLRSLDLFHFAGHGRFAGVGGSDSSLSLADDRRLSIGQILVLGGAPRFVLLSGCETGSTGVESRVEGLGLANAFVLAGSRAVVASVRKVDDRTAEPLFSDLYRRWRGGENLAESLQQALLAWRRSQPQADWRSFRLIEP